jgi:predicted amidophosphoribosyltransferase
MAVCPKCQGEMGQTEAVCPHCGYDFPEPARSRALPTWVSLGLVAAWVAVVIVWSDTLVVQLIVTVCLVLSLVGVWRFLRGEV